MAYFFGPPHSLCVCLRACVRCFQLSNSDPELLNVLRHAPRLRVFSHIVWSRPVPWHLRHDRSTASSAGSTDGDRPCGLSDGGTCPPGNRLDPRCSDGHLSANVATWVQRFWWICPPALPRSVRSSTSVLHYSSRLETELFARSYQQSYWICLCVTVTQHFCSVILKSFDLRHVIVASNTN